MNSSLSNSGLLIDLSPDLFSSVVLDQTVSLSPFVDHPGILLKGCSKLVNTVGGALVGRGVGESVNAS